MLWHFWTQHHTPAVMFTAHSVTILPSLTWTFPLLVLLSHCCLWKLNLHIKYWLYANCSLLKSLLNLHNLHQQLTVNFQKKEYRVSIVKVDEKHESWGTGSEKSAPGIQQRKRRLVSLVSYTNSLQMSPNFSRV